MKVLMHLDAGSTKVSLLRAEGQGLANGGITWDMPTSAIPPDLRSIGSRFVVVGPRFAPDASDSPESIREMTRQMQIEEFSDDDTHGANKTLERTAAPLLRFTSRACHKGLLVEPGRGRAAVAEFTERTMKSTLLPFCLSTLIVCASAAEAPKPQPATTTAVAVDADKQTLVIRCEIAGAASEHRITFPQEIADFRYCRWMGDYGIAAVARTGTNASAQYFYSAFPLASGSKNHKPARIPAPWGLNPVLGIGNTGGDSLVITALQHRRSPSESVSGWTYIDNCPLTEGGLAIGHVITFTVPAERPQPQ